MGDVELNQALEQAGRKAVQDQMAACYEAMRVQGEEVSKCKETSARTRLAMITGRESGDNITKQEMQKFVRDGARHAVADAMESCMIPEGCSNPPEEVKDMVRQALGEWNVTNTDVSCDSEPRTLTSPLLYQEQS